jgi:hypothetical protein
MVIRIPLPRRVQDQGFFDGGGRNRSSDLNFSNMSHPQRLFKATFQAGGLTYLTKSKDFKTPSR